MAGDDRIELTSDRQAGQRSVGNERRILAGEIVDYGENAKSPSVAQLAVHKIERSALVRPLWQGERRPVAERSLAAAATADLQPFLGVASSGRR